MNIILSEIVHAIIILIVVFFVGYAWNLAYKTTIEIGLKKTLFNGFFVCALISFGFALYLGQSTCIDSEEGPMGSTCTEYAEDGYEPTNEQRAAEFAYYMTLLYIPVVLAVFNAEKGNKIYN